ncbi:MAG: ribosome small subunit-dependent GTPase A [Bacteroidota bacterium]
MSATFDVDPVELERIGYDAHFQTRFNALKGELVPGRIAIAHGESYVAWTREGNKTARLTGRRIADWRQAAERPQVGDWVAGTYSDTADCLLIEHLLERRTCLVRMAAGDRGEAQVIAANVDVVGIVSAFGDGSEGEARDRRLLNERRLERYVSAVAQSGARAVLIVNKSDLNPRAPAIAATLGERFAPIPVLVTSAERRFGLDTLSAWLSPGMTFGLVGMSGVGKSTLVNALLERGAQRIGDIRDGDARGRHTTTHRELFVMANGALLIDTPGMREFGLWETETLASFDDVEAVAAGCRFSDCGHATEPGCAVRRALDDGTLAASRLEGYRKLTREIAARASRAGQQRSPRSAGGPRSTRSGRGR